MGSWVLSPVKDVGTNRPATPADQGRQDSEAPVDSHQEVLIKPLDSLIAVASGNGTPKHCEPGHQLIRSTAFDAGTAFLNPMHEILTCCGQRSKLEAAGTRSQMT